MQVVAYTCHMLILQTRNKGKFAQQSMREALHQNEALAFPETFPQLPEAPEKNPLNAANCEELCIHRISGVGRNISRRNAETLVGNTAHCEKVCQPQKSLIVDFLRNAKKLSSILHFQRQSLGRRFKL